MKRPVQVIYTNKNVFKTPSHLWLHMLVVLPAQETEEEGSIEPLSLRPAWATH
jgi:hypothetical protein